MIAPGPSCYGCDGTGHIVWAQSRGVMCLCVRCDKCGERATTVVNEGTEDEQRLCDACANERRSHTIDCPAYENSDRACKGDCPEVLP